MSQNYFLDKSPEELREVAARMVSLIANNHVRAGALKTEGTVELSPEDVFINVHLVDRAGALLNACLASGYSYDAAEWTTELDARSSKARGMDTGDRARDIRFQIGELLQELAHLQQDEEHIPPLRITGGPHLDMTLNPVVICLSEHREVADIDYHDPETGAMVRELIPGPSTTWFAVLG